MGYVCMTGNRIHNDCSKGTKSTKIYTTVMHGFYIRVLKLWYWHGNGIHPSGDSWGSRKDNALGLWMIISGWNSKVFFSAMTLTGSDRNGMSKLVQVSPNGCPFKTSTGRKSQGNQLSQVHWESGQ